MSHIPTVPDVRKITANLPAGLLEGAMKLSGAGITETLTAALTVYQRQRAQDAARALRGTVKFSITKAQLKKERE